MGTWGPRSFENDAALDWAADLAESQGVAFLESSLVVSRENGYLDSEAGVSLIAAAEVVAALLGRPAANLPEDVQSWVSENQQLAVGHLLPKAVSAIGEVLGEGSELRELWEENGEDFQVWQAIVTNLRHRLSESTSSVQHRPAPGRETKAKRARLGDVYAIRICDQVFAVAKVIYVSHHFRNVIAVAVSDSLVERPIAATSPPAFDKGVIYTAQACAQHEWIFLTKATVSEADHLRTTRLVAGNVYCGDQVLREASDLDRKTLVHMGVAGCGAVVLLLEKLFRGGGA